jgi:hypothetical protein
MDETRVDINDPKWQNVLLPYIRAIGSTTAKAIQDHLKTSRMKNLGGWNFLVHSEPIGPYETAITTLIRETFLLKKKGMINEMTVDVIPSWEHDPPDALQCVKLVLKMGSRTTPYGHHDRIFELRVFRQSTHEPTYEPLSHQAEFDRSEWVALATYEDEYTKANEIARGAAVPEGRTTWRLN